MSRTPKYDWSKDEAPPSLRKRRIEWWVYPFPVVACIGVAIVFVGCAVGLWMLTLGGGCALGWCPFT
jgi:hypothetical protein